MIRYGLGDSFRHASCEVAATMDNYHLTKVGDTWHLTKQGAIEAAETFPTKEEAIKGSAGYLEGKTASLKIHRADGVIEEERTYPRSADPADTPG